jgi:hypothetical protein
MCGVSDANELPFVKHSGLASKSDKVVIISDNAFLNLYIVAEQMVGQPASNRPSILFRHLIIKIYILILNFP